jgi:hypothetical protein
MQAAEADVVRLHSHVLEEEVTALRHQLAGLLSVQAR